eukprot:SAG22_NODE_11138_length_499_cov_0.550000_1_plen_88_part_01
MADSDYDSEDLEDDWQRRKWKTTVARMSLIYSYDRRRVPYKQFMPQVPFYMHLAAAGRHSGKGKAALRVRLPDTIVFGMGRDPGSDGQ